MVLFAEVVKVNVTRTTKYVESDEAQCIMVKQRNFVFLIGVLREGLHHESPRRWRQNWSPPGAHV